MSLIRPSFPQYFEPLHLDEVTSTRHYRRNGRRHPEEGEKDFTVTTQLERIDPHQHAQEYYQSKT
jgi:hypothetical protein